MCNQGPWQHQLAVLATLKSSPLLVLHQADQLVPRTCAARGFTAYFGTATPPAPQYPMGYENISQGGNISLLDHCYPPSVRAAPAPARALCHNYAHRLAPCVLDRQTLWARVEINASNPEVSNTLDIETWILGNFSDGAWTSERHFEPWAEERGLNVRLLDSNPSCNCLPGSGVAEGRDPGAGPDVPRQCNRAHAPPEKFSPIRDWWDGYPGTPRPREPGSPQQRARILAAEARRRYA